MENILSKLYSPEAGLVAYNHFPCFMTLILGLFPFSLRNWLTLQVSASVSHVKLSTLSEQLSVIPTLNSLITTFCLFSSLCVCVCVVCFNKLWALWGQGLHLCSLLHIHYLIHSTNLLINKQSSWFPIHIWLTKPTLKMKCFQQYISLCFYICSGFLGEDVYVIYMLILLRKILSPSFYWICKALY